MDAIGPDDLTARDKALLAYGEGLYVFPVRAPDGGVSCLARMAYTWAILHDLNDTGFDNRWCYHDATTALVALVMWDGADSTEPDGWHRHPSSGRRRDHGDPSTEYVNW